MKTYTGNRKIITSIPLRVVSVCPIMMVLLLIPSPFVFVIHSFIFSVLTLNVCDIQLALSVSNKVNFCLSWDKASLNIPTWDEIKYTTARMISRAKNTTNTIAITRLVLRCKKLTTGLRRIAKIRAKTRGMIIPRPI